MIFDKQTAIVLLESGEPSGPQQVDAFLREVLGDKEATPLPLMKRMIRPLVVETTLAEHGEAYRKDFDQIGVDSPLQRVCGGQANGIAEILGCEGYVVMNHGSPGVGEAVDLMIKEGMQRAILVPMNSYGVQVSNNATMKKFEEHWQAAQRKTGDLRRVDQWHQDEAIHKTLAHHFQETLSLIPKNAQVIFLAPDPGGAQAKADPEVENRVQAMMNRILAHLNLNQDAHLAWLPSRLHPKGLEPQVDSLVDSAVKNGVGSIALVPLGWASDRFDTLCSIDMHCGRLLRSHKLHLYRVPTINDRQEFLMELAKHIAKECGEHTA